MMAVIRHRRPTNVVGGNEAKRSCAISVLPLFQNSPLLARIRSDLTPAKVLGQLASWHLRLAGNTLALLDRVGGAPVDKGLHQVVGRPLPSTEYWKTYRQDTKNRAQSYPLYTIVSRIGIHISTSWSF